MKPLPDTENTGSGAGWLRRKAGRLGVRARLVCFPHAGGSANFFYPWRKSTPADVELVSVQYPGRQDRIGEPLVDDMDEMLAGLVPELERVPHRPTVFLGHSMGAAVAYEAARRMSRKPDLLVLSARPAPHIDCRTGLSDVDDAAMISRLERLGGLPPDSLTNTELRELVMLPLRADYRLVEAYAPRTPERLDIDILALAGEHDPEVRVADVAEWRAATSRGFSLNVLSGDHFFVSHHAATVVSLALEQLPQNAAPG